MLPNNFPIINSEAEKELCRRSFRDFAEAFWPMIDPHPWRGGWHIDCICDHLQAVSDGTIDRLLINIPPRHSKSSLCSVLWPAWDWISNPGQQWLSMSYESDLTTRDCVRSRRIIMSKEYRELVEADDKGELEWNLCSDQNVKTRYENTAAGYRRSSSVAKGDTGWGGSVIMVDDALNVKKISATTLRELKLWWTEAMPTRLNENGAFIIIEQRTNEQDLSGLILAGDDEYVHVCLAGRYEGMNRIFTPLKWEDPRKKIDEPLWMSEKQQTTVERGLSAYAKAGQIQQRPTPRGGGTFKRDNFQLIDNVDESQIEKSVRYYDKAGTDDDGDYTVGSLMYLMKDGSYVVADVVRGQWSLSKREAQIKTTSMRDFEKLKVKLKKPYEIHGEQEPGSGGKDSAKITKDRLHNNKDGSKTVLIGVKVEFKTVTGSKVDRADQYGVEVENHNIFVLNRSWTKAFLDEHSVFPNGTNDDQVDASSGAFNALWVKRISGGVW